MNRALRYLNTDNGLPNESWWMLANDRTAWKRCKGFNDFTPFTSMLLGSAPRTDGVSSHYRLCKAMAKWQT